MNKGNYKILLSCTILLNLVMSCACFPKKQFPETSHINANNINLLEGTYAMKNCFPEDSDGIIDMGLDNDESNQYPTFFHEVHNGLLVKPLKINSKKNYTFSLKISSPKRIEIEYLEDDLIVRKKNIRYTLKEDGFVYIKHRNFKIIGIPYVLGGFNKKRSRLALNEDNYLLFETSEFTSGGVFYAGFIAPVINFASKSKYKKIYQRIH
ncbi:hypothetical protein [Tamlana flava]|uniref:hypothetical protein n=1 Tax=Tamlana flava TaxID=3158572 RepID=UPI00351BB99F